MFSIESLPRCVGTILSPRHVLSAASCFCNYDRRFDVVFRSRTADCSDRAMGKRRHNYGNPMDTVLLATFPYTPQGQRFMPEFIEVSWVSLHPRYVEVTTQVLLQSKFRPNDSTDTKSEQICVTELFRAKC